MEKKLEHRIDFHRFENKREMDVFKLRRNLAMNDMERFNTFITLMRLARTLKEAPKIHKTLK